MTKVGYIVHRGKNTLLLALGSLFLFSLATYALAAARPSPYIPGDTLDPTDCSPGETNCFVSILAIDNPVTDATEGSLLFAGASGALTQDNANLFWDDTNNRLGVGTDTPLSKFEVRGSTGSGQGIRASANASAYVEMYYGASGPTISGSTASLLLAPQGTTVLQVYNGSGGVISVGTNTVSNKINIPNASYLGTVNQSGASARQIIGMNSSDRIVIGGSGDNSYFGGRVGIGSGNATPSAQLQLLSTTEQLRVNYDASNYYSTTVGSTGGVTFDAVGAGAGFTFSDTIKVGPVTVPINSIANDIIIDGLNALTASPSSNTSQWGRIVLANAGGATEYRNNTGGHTFYTYPSGVETAVFSISNSTGYSNIQTQLVFGVGGNSYNMNRDASTGFLRFYGNQTSFVGYLFTGVDGEWARINGSGNLGLGTGATVSAKAHILATTEQLRVGYDANNYYSTTVSSTGGVTFDATGTSPDFTFSDTVFVPSPFSVGSVSTQIVNQPGSGSAYFTRGSLYRVSLNDPLGTDGAYISSSAGSDINTLYTSTSGYTRLDTAGGTHVDVQDPTTAIAGSAGGIELSFGSGANHIPSYGIIRGADSAFGGSTTTTIEIAMYGGKNTTSNVFGDVILQHDGTESRGFVGVGIFSPVYKLDVLTNTASYVTNIFNDGNSADRSGLRIQSGLDDHTVAGPSTLIGFFDGDGTSVGSITFGSSATAYNTTSDQRLKENISDSTTGLSLLNQIKVRDYAFIADNSHTIYQGFIAQELYDVYPRAVTRPVNEESGYWMVDYSKLMPLVVKAIQDIDIKLETLTSLDTSESSSLGSLIKQFLGNASNTITDLYAKAIHSESINTNEITTDGITSDRLCLEDLCITKAELQSLLNSNGSSVVPEDPFVSGPETPSNGEEEVNEEQEEEVVEEQEPEVLPEEIPEPSEQVSGSDEQVTPESAE